MRDKIAKNHVRFRRSRYTTCSHLFFCLSLSPLSLSLPPLSLFAFYSLSLHVSFACRKRLNSRLLTFRHAFFQRSVVNFIQRRVNATRANRAQSAEPWCWKEKAKILHRPAVLYIYIPRWSHPFRRENGQWHRRMLSREFRWSPIIGGQSNASLKLTRESSRYINSFTLSKLMNIDRSAVRYEQIFYFSLFIFYFYCIIYASKFKFWSIIGVVSFKSYKIFVKHSRISSE